VEYIFTNAEQFAVNKIEIFQIGDYMALLTDIKKCANRCLFQERADGRVGSRDRLMQEKDGRFAKGD
jgi:hypothetical protein